MRIGRRLYAVWEEDGGFASVEADLLQSDERYLRGKVKEPRERRDSG